MARRLVHAAAAALLVVCLSLAVDGSMMAAGSKRSHVGRGSVAAGRAHSILATPDGRALTWGAGSRGQLGDGMLLNRSTPVQVAGLDNVVAVSAGAAHTVAMTATGEVYAWGANSFGRLGDGTRKRRLRPVRVAGLSSIVMVAAGRAHTLALTTSGSVYAWGRNTNGQLGTGQNVSSLVPLRIEGLTNIVSIAAGDNHSLAVSRDGRLFTWGDNQFSMLGDGTTRDRDRPVAIALTDVVAVAGGAAHSLALRRDGSVYSWGRGLDGALGTGTKRIATTPNVISGLTATAIAAGRRFSGAIQRDGRVATWGANESGQLGDHTTTSRDRPVVVEGLSNVDALALGDAHAIAVTTMGDVRTWGEGDAGRLGSGSIADRLTPIEVVSDVPDWGVEPGDDTGSPAPPDPPAIAPPSGVFATVIAVNLTPASAGDVIRYTLDGTDPTAVSLIYSGPLSVSSSTTVTARSYSSAGESSVVRSETYTFDTVAPSIAVSTSPPLHQGWMTTAVTVTFECADDFALASCPAPVIVSNDGVQQVTGVAIDRAGNRAAVTFAVRIDRDPPELSIGAPKDALITSENELTITGTATDTASGVGDVRCNGEPATVIDGSIICVVALRPGRNEIVLHAVDVAGHNASTAITVMRIGTPTTLTLTPATRTIEVNEVAKLMLRDEFGAEVRAAAWTTSAPSIVTLSNDDPPVVTAAALGTVIITAEKDGLIAEATIRVSPGLVPGDARWTLPARPQLSSGPPLFANRVDRDGPAMFTVETQTSGGARLRAVNADGEVIWQQDTGGIPIMGDSFGGAIVGVPADPSSGTDYRAYSRIGGGSAKPWRFESRGALARPAQARDGTLYAIESLFGGFNIDGDEVWDKYAIVMDGATGSLISRALLPRDVGQFVSAREGGATALAASLNCGTKRYDWAPDTIGPVVGKDGRGYLLVTQQQVLETGDCERRPDRAIDVSFNLMMLSPSAEPETINIESTSCVEAPGTLPCDLWVGADQLMPDAIGGTLVTLEHGTLGDAPFVEKSLTRVVEESGDIIERAVSPGFSLEMMGQDGVAIAYDDGWKAIDVTTGDTQWSSPLTGLAPLAARPEGGLAALDVSTGELKLVDATGAIESTQSFGLASTAVHELGDWIGLRNNELTSVVGDFDDATRFAASADRTGQQAVRTPGVGIWMKWHNVNPLVPFQHLSIRITPGDGFDWKLDPVFGSYFQSYVDSHGNVQPAVDVYGNTSITLGAGPPPPGDATTFCAADSILVGGPNRPGDQETRPLYQVEEIIPTVSEMNSLIEKLLTLDANYGDDLPYECFPEPDKWNSNSYALGLWLAAGREIHPYITGFRFLFPGYSRPLPSTAFQPH